MTTYTVKKTITSQDIEDVLESAWQGMTYWSDEAYVVGNRGADLSTALTSGQYIKVHDAEEDKWYNLTLKKFLKGLELTDDFDLEQYDMYDADALVQRALFGEVVYG